MDLEDTIPEVVEDQQEELVDTKVAAATKKGDEASNELVSFLSSCGIDDESVHGAFVAFGVQSPEDLSELVEEVRRTSPLQNARDGVHKEALLQKRLESPNVLHWCS